MSSKAESVSPGPSRPAPSSGGRDGVRCQAGQNPRKRDQILDGARRVFREMGFDAASMNDITRAAGVSKGTVYVYFANKEELFEAIVDDERRKVFSDLYGRLNTHTEQNLEDVRQTLVSFGCTLASRLCSEPVVRAQRTVIAVAARMPDLGARFFEKGPLRGHAILSDYLSAQVERGLLSIPDINLAAFQLFELCIAGIMRARLFAHASAPPDDTEICHIVNSGVDMFLAAYGVSDTTD